MIHYKKVKAAYLAASNSQYTGFKVSELGYLKVTALPCRVHEGEHIGPLVVSKVTRSEKDRQAIIVAKKP